ncbi:hypothetical protein L3Q82_014300 [Scortum barcoo]|uniref:Uncharacterized protein n=1 Tax=Scortum barcoo TaxID=214431 RepID=A0ACB8VW63_9TELE|nr:hypothetical protein L3Q82_014300 [Scortum barcoo]
MASRFGGADYHPSRFHTRLQTAPVHAEDYETGPVTKGSPAGVQHALGTGLTYCRQCEPSSCSGRTETEQPLAKAPGPHTRRSTPQTEYHEGHGRMPSPDPQSTCGLVGQTPINPQAPCGGYRAGPVFHDQDENRIVPPESEGRLLAEFSSPVPWRRPSRGG